METQKLKQHKEKLIELAKEHDKQKESILESVVVPGLEWMEKTK